MSRNFIEGVSSVSNLHEIKPSDKTSAIKRWGVLFVRSFVGQTLKKKRTAERDLQL
jgi:hypothetical protein